MKHVLTASILLGLTIALSLPVFAQTSATVPSLSSAEPAASVRALAAPPAAAAALEPQRSAGAVAATLPHDLSAFGMFMAADIVVKAVMIGLAFASVVTWTVWVAKSLELLGSTRRLRRAAGDLAASPSLAGAAETIGFRKGPAAEMVRAASAEVRLSEGGGAGLKERVASRLERIEVGAGRRMMRGTGVLATIGSTSPFVGLFGTVWGIMNAFVGISKAQTTNLAVVAPGIAEALLATAIGLVAAIPAVIIYNVFARAIAGYRSLLGDVSAETQRIVSRDLDRSRSGRIEAAE